MSHILLSTSKTKKGENFHLLIMPLKRYMNDVGCCNEKGIVKVLECMLLLNRIRSIENIC